MNSTEPYDWWWEMFLALHTLSGVLRLSGAAPGPGLSNSETETEPVCLVCEARLDRVTPLPDTRRRDHSPRNKAPPFLYRDHFSIYYQFCSVLALLSGLIFLRTFKQLR